MCSRRAPEAETSMIAGILVAASAGILLILGGIHLAYTFHGPKFDPRDPALAVAMRVVSPVISRETTMWKAWVGFNASHAMGAILFGLVYGYLALMQRDLLFSSPYLQVVGLAMVGGFVALGRVYWFSVPYRSCQVALLCYCAGIAVAVA